MARYNTQLLTPPKEEEEIHPYRRAWTSIVFSIASLATLSLVTFALFNVLGLNVSEVIRPYANLFFAIIPAVFWAAFALYRERFVPQPRTPLLSVFLVALLFANAISVPFIEEFLAVDRWLTLESAIERIIGYTFTIGIVQATTIYLILRYMVWKTHLRIRLDAIAYSEAIAVGITVVNNLVFIANGTPPIDVVVARVYSNYSLAIIASAIIGYGFSILRFDNRNLFILPASIVIASASTGLAIPLRSGLVNATFSQFGISAPKPIFGLGFTIAFSILPLIIIAFLISNVERKDEEIKRSDL